MAILENTKTESTGIKKIIDKDSAPVALDILQRGIYAFPIQSTVRELISNSYDSINEREQAKSILTGKSKPEDYFDVEKIDGVYHASGWDPSYFDLNYLSDDMNSYILYEEGQQRDLVRIKDNGVGIGKDRMIGYFMLAWSSKRTQKGALGKWGLGSKVALSLGITSYTVISRYNGQKFKFEVYLDNIVSTTPKFSNGKKNNSIFVDIAQEDGSIKQFEMFYEETSEKNGLELQIPFKKHNKKEFFQAVEAQLMYIPNVIFKYKAEGSLNYELIDIKAEILYRDKNIIISNNKIFDKPHILLGTGDGLINYGFVAFKELEIEAKNGAVGLILDINDVEVTPSRESVIWSSKTRTAILNSYNKVVETATEFINKELKNETDYLSWIQKVSIIKQSLLNQAFTNQKSVLQRLAGIIDASFINKIYFTQGVFNKLYVTDPKTMFGDKIYVRLFEYDKYAKKVVRTKVKQASTLAGKTVYVGENGSNKYVDRYIYEEISKGGFIHIKKLAGWNLENTSKLLCESPNIVNYDNFIVPQIFMDKYILEESQGDFVDDDESASAIESYDRNYLANLRKQNQEILYHVGTIEHNNVVFRPTSIKYYDISTKFFNNISVVYSTFNDRDLMEWFMKIEPVSHTCWGSIRLRPHTEDSLLEKLYGKDRRVEFILISKDNEKYFNNNINFTPLNKYIGSYKSNGTFIFNKDIITSLTLLLLKSSFLKNLSFCHSFVSDTDIKYYGEKYVLYKHLGYREFIASFEMLPSFFKGCVDYHLTKHTDPDADLNSILKTLNEHLPEGLCPYVDEITDIQAIDVKKYDEIKEIYDYFISYEPIYHSITKMYKNETQTLAIEVLNKLLPPKPFS